MNDPSQIRSVRPPDALAPWVAGVWTVEAEDGHAVHTAPDGCIDIVLIANDEFEGAFVCGAQRASVSRTLAGKTRIAGVSLRPGAGAILGVSAISLPPDWLPLVELGLGGIAPSKGVEGLLGWIAERAARADFDPRLEEALAGMTAGVGPPSVAALARGAGVSERTLGRLFDRYVGMSPSAYRRIVRFNRAVAALSSTDPDSLAGLAFSLGFADQSHLARELRELGGVRATRLRTARLAGQFDATPISSRATAKHLS